MESALKNIISKTALVSKAKNIISPALKLSLLRNFSRLNTVLEKADKSSVPEASKDQIKKIRDKIHAVVSIPIKAWGEELFSSRECRLIGYHASDIVDASIQYKHIAIILEKYWNDWVLSALLFFVLNNWLDLDGERSPIYNLFFDKLRLYNGSRPRYTTLKNCIDYFKKSKLGVDGALLLGKDLMNEHIPLLEFQKKLDIPKFLFSSEYFQKVIRTYYITADCISEEIEDILKEHHNGDTSKLVLADLINNVETHGRVREDRLRTQSTALRVIGHPSEKGAWTLFKKNDTSQKFIYKAQDILKNWLIQDYINEIFRTLFEDYRRRDFWIKYSEMVSDVLVIGPSEGKRRLSRIPAIKDSLDYYFKSTSSPTGAYAFVMSIGQYKFIEFSENGNALYIYNQEPEIERKLKSSYIATVNSLKDTSLETLSRTLFGESCRHPHSSNDWETPLKNWIKRNVRA